VSGSAFTVRGHGVHSAFEDSIRRTQSIPFLDAAQQEWIDPATEPLLEDILEIASQLDIDAGDKRLWKELFEKSEQL
jgi:hypothetical protein